MEVLENTNEAPMSESATKEMASKEGQDVGAPRADAEETKQKEGQSAPSLLEAVAQASEAWASEQAQKATSERSASANTKKAQLDLFRTVECKSLERLNGCLASGTDPNFHIARSGATQSPLNISLREDWPEGALALIEAGARESTAIAATCGGQQNISLAISLRSHLSAPKDARVLAALMEAETDPAIRGVYAKGALNNLSLARWLLDNGEHGAMSVGDWASAEFNALRGAHGGSAGALKQLSAHLKALWRAVPGVLDLNREERWLAILRLDHPPLMGALARSGAHAPGGWRMTLDGNCFPHHERGFAPASLIKPSQHAHRGATHERVYGQSVSVPIWTVAAILGSVKILAALGAAGDLRERALAMPGAMEMLAFGAGPQALREAARQGVDLALCAGHKGDTPLHVVCGSRNVSQTAALEMAKVCPAWCGMRNAAGQEPAQTLKKNPTLNRIDEDATIAQMQKLAMSRDLREVKKGRTKKAKEEGAPAAKAAPKTTRRL
jgi:hypothetical protein